MVEEVLKPKKRKQRTVHVDQQIDDEVKVEHIRAHKNKRIVVQNEDCYDPSTRVVQKRVVYSNDSCSYDDGVQYSNRVVRVERGGQRVKPSHGTTKIIIGADGRKRIIK